MTATSQIDAWSAIPSLAYTLTDDEARVGSAAVRPLIQRWSSIGYIIVGCGFIALGITRLVLDPSHSHQWWRWEIFFGIAYIGLGIIPLLPRRAAQREFALMFSANGIACTTPHVAVIPWRSVLSVRATNGVFIFRCTKRRTFVLPKRALDDGGKGLWHALQGRLIGQYQLVRRPDSQLIVNTGDVG